MTDLPPLTLYSVPETPAEIELAIVKIVDPDGFLVASNNLSDVDDPEEARQNLGIVGGVKPDWNAEPNTASEILNKPDLGTAAAANVEDFATADQGELAESALQPGSLSDYVTELELSTALSGKQDSGDYLTPSSLSSYETTTQLNARDTANRDRANHTGTQTASTISDFDIEVSNNTDVAANTAARHNAVTVTDSSTIDFTLTGQDVTASVKAGSITTTQLSTAVNTSLGKADSAVQPTALASYQPLATVLTNTTASFTTAQETKLAGIAEGAEVNVNADWNAVSGDAQILNKPTLGTAAATNSTDYATAAQGTLANTALQPDDIGVTVQSYNAGTVISNPTGITGADVVTNIVSLTQAEYNAIAVPNASTLYVITD